MRIHQEGYRLLITMALTLAGLNLLAGWLTPSALLIVLLLSVLLFALVLQFFRHPVRNPAEKDDRLVYSPADGRVVVIEETEESEYFNDKRLQVSIFMSVFDVHCNRNPVGGIVTHYQYHPGRYLAAWNPKSSTENERNTLVIDTGRTQILVRQIAGLLARRIRNYLQVGSPVEQGAEMGFIKFGSRVDLFLPLDTRLEVEVGQQVYAGRTLLARLED